MTTGLRERFLGCLLGGAMGDALGAPIEFNTIDDIRAKYGSAGLRRFVPAYGRTGALTDDTQMTLFTAEGLIRAHAGVDAGNADDVVASVYLAYLRWLETQGGPDAHSSPRGWLIENDVLHVRRAPGNTCMSALASGTSGTTTRRINNSKGCGGVMRVAPVGLAARGRAAYELGAACAAITHGHPTGFIASGAFAMIIVDLVDGSDLTHAVDSARADIVRHDGHEETLAALDAACALAADGDPTPERVESLGGGWIAEEALAIGVYCALVADDVRHGMMVAVNHSGDSDSTGSITGNLLGALHGVDALPPDLLEGLEARDLIGQVANDLADAYVDGRTPDLERYPPD